MKNLEQIRAANAWKCSQGAQITRGQDGGEVIKKIPPMIINHGLLATMAYGFADRREAWKEFFNHIAKHLSDPQVAIIPNGKDTLEKMNEFLTSSSADSLTLQRATNETMEWLKYARRFVK